MRKVIIESPYSGDELLNMMYLRACLRDALIRGELPFASHGLFTQPGVLDDNDPAQRELGIQAGFAWRRVADTTIVYTDLGISGGMQLGIEHALSIGHAIEYRTLPSEILAAVRLNSAPP